MRNIVALFFLIPHLIYSQDGYEIITHSNSNFNIFPTVKIFSASKSQMVFLKLKSNSNLVLCTLNLGTGEEECADVIGYKKLFDADLLGIEIVTSKAGEHGVFLYKRKKGIKQVYVASYDLKENRIGVPHLLHTIEGYTRRNDRLGSFRVLSSENEEFFAIVESSPGGQSMTQKPFLKMSMILLNSKFEKIKSHTNDLDFTLHENIYPSGDKPFSNRYWWESVATLTNEGDFYYLQNRSKDFALITSTFEADHMVYQVLAKSRFNNTLPSLNENCKSGVEFWSITKDKLVNQFKININHSKNGKPLVLTEIEISDADLSSLDMQDDDSFLIINAVTTTMSGDTVISLCPLKNYPSGFMDPITLRLNGMFIFKVQERKLIPVFKKRYETKLSDGQFGLIGYLSFAWGVEFNNKLLYFYVQDDSDDYLYKTQDFYVSVIEVDLFDFTAKPLSLKVPKEFQKIESYAPNIFSAKSKDFVILMNEGFRGAEGYYFIYPQKKNKVRRM